MIVLTGACMMWALHGFTSDDEGQMNCTLGVRHVSAYWARDVA